MLSIEDLGHASLLRQPARGYGRWSSEAGKRELVAVIVTERVVTCDWTWTAEHPYFDTTLTPPGTQYGATAFRSRGSSLEIRERTATVLQPGRYAVGRAKPPRLGFRLR